MVGIFALLNGEARSCYSMHCCDLRHNHFCQLAHYGFCLKPLSDVRRALVSPVCLMQVSSLSLPLRTPGGWGEGGGGGGGMVVDTAKTGERYCQTLSSLLFGKT